MTVTGRAHRLIGAILAALLLVLFVLPAQAQEPAPAGDPAAQAAQDEEHRKQEAKRHFVRGLELTQNEQWDAALAEFLASVDLYPTRVAVRNAAVSLRQLNRHAEALEMYERLLKLFGAGMAPDEIATTNDAIAQLKKATGALAVTSEPSEANVVVNGQQAGTTPLAKPFVVSAGTHTVRVLKEGYEPFETQVQVAGGQTKSIQASLQALVKSGRLTVQEADGKKLEVVVDGAAVGETPWTGSLAVGSHTVLLRGADDMGTPPSIATVFANQLSTLNLRATKLDAAIRIEPTPSNARVDIDGVTVGNGIWEGRLKSGEHKIEVTAEGFLAYRRDVRVRSNQQEVLRLALERDPTNPMWRESVFVPHIYVEAVAGAAWSPSFGGSAGEACSRDECSDGGGPLGFAGGARGGYQLTSGLGLEVFLGYLYMSQTVTRTIDATFEQSSVTSSDYQDTTTLRGPFAAASASYRFFEKTPLLFRIWAGAMRGKASFENEGTFAGGTLSGPVRASVAERSANIWVPLVGPEVRFGYQFSRSFAMDFGVAGLMMFAPETVRAGATSAVLSGDARDIPTGPPLGVLTLPREQGFGTFFTVLPTLGGRFDF